MVLSLLPVLLLGLLLFNLDENGMKLMVGLVFAPIILYAVVNHGAATLGLSICLLGVIPFYWGVSKTPKIFLDEILLLFYLMYFVFSYFVVKEKHFRSGGGVLTIILSLFLLLHMLPFATKQTDLIALRNFFETYVLGGALFYLFYNEVDRSNRGKVVDAIVWTTLLLAALMVLEKVSGYNPIRGLDADSMYISPEIAEQAKGVYRPYINFLTPSEAGTFIALGLPFLIWKGRQMNRFLWAIALTVTGIAILVNYTRGVWLAVGITTVIFSQRLRKYLPLLFIGTAAVLILALSIFHGHPAVQRLRDPTNFLNRLFYWGLALDITKQNMLLGIGHMNFKALYLNFVTYLPSGVAGLNVKEVFVADNSYLTTMVEHGLLGFTSLIALYIAISKKLRALIKQFTLKGMDDTRDLAKACLMSFLIFVVAGMLVDIHLFAKVTKYFFILMGIGWSLSKDLDAADGTAYRQF